MTYDQAMLEYGCDKPDLRFDMKISDLTAGLCSSEFPPFARGLAADDGVIRGIRVPEGSKQFGGKERKQFETALKDTDLVSHPSSGGRL